MGNLIKKSAGGLALQVTREARSAGLVEEDTDGAATRLAPVHVYGVDDLLIIAETDRIEIDCRGHLVATAVSDTESVYPGGTATVEIANLARLIFWVTGAAVSPERQCVRNESKNDPLEIVVKA